ncbi:TIGR02678 family protein [Lentzea xinjiangensis]|uniref:TIGR02678 family protein n=1 Tax=Lentzea xinjiangensis TaxID=402600 RepID=A0A1H9VBX0_9PSEU|nr:TIGR02678 family protein [Lentzea xinjiangensis]SES19175.1 TIGR02678 family protein [Lentzea xinjiangensis]
MSRTGNQLARLESEEVARGVRLLLARPLLTAVHDHDGFDLIRRRREPIVKWFDYYCGWRVLVEPRAGYARLFKTTQRPDRTRPLFDRRRYMLLCLVCAELVTTPTTTAEALTTRVRQAAAADGLPSFDLDRRSDRSALADVLGFLEEQGAVENDDPHVRADPMLITRLLAAPAPPSTVDSIEDLTREARYESAHRSLWQRHSVMRRLVDDPVVYRDELTAGQLAFLTSPSGRKIVQTGIGLAGCTLEERAEGYLVVDADAIATDTRFPDDDSNAKVAALLLLDRLAQGPARFEDLVEEARELLTKFRTWAKAYQSDGGAGRLAADGLELLEAFGLARTENGTVRRLPAAARYAVEELHD